MINNFKNLIYNLFFREKVSISQDESLKGKAVIITGASRGIGLSSAEVLLNKGAKLVLVARNVTGLKKIFQNNPNCLVLQSNVTSRNDCIKTVERTLKLFGKIDVLVNLAGLYTEGNIENTNEEQFDSLINTNVKGIFLMCSAVIPFMKKNKKGLIINMGSRISHNSDVKPGRVAYATTKYAVEGFSYALGRELKSFGIRVSCLMPATVNTFRSLHGKKYLSPFRLGEIISMLIKYEDVHFESIILKSVKEDI